MYLQPNKLHQRAAIREKINLIKFEYIIVNALFVEKKQAFEIHLFSHFVVRLGLGFDDKEFIYLHLIRALLYNMQRVITEAQKSKFLVAIDRGVIACVCTLSLSHWQFNADCERHVYLWGEKKLFIAI